MKEELQSKLVEILGSIQTAAGKAGDFAMAQLPEIAQSYVLYGRALETSAVLLSLLVFVTGFYVAMKYGFLNKEAVHQTGYSEGEWFAHRIVAVIGGLFGALGGFIGVCTNAPAFMLVWFAPKVWLLKEIAGLIK